LTAALCDDYDIPRDAIDKYYNDIINCILKVAACTLLIRELTHIRVGCSIGGLCVNVLAYADDLVLCAPSWVGLQHLIDVLANHVNTICMFCNVIKTVCMVFSPVDKSKIVAHHSLHFVFVAIR